MTNNALIMLIGLVVSGNCFALDVAQCSNQKGKTYYPFVGMMDMKHSGWTDDGITGGMTTLSLVADNQYDILFVDATKSITSSIQDGGKVFMLSRGARDVSLIVIYEGKAAEIYTFLVDKSGKAEFTQVTSRGGDKVMFPRTSIFRGDCKFVNLNLIK